MEAKDAGGGAAAAPGAREGRGSGPWSRVFGMRVRAAAALVLLLAAAPAHASAVIDGAQLSVWWGIPFIGILLSIALCPVLIPHTWEHHYGKITAAWSLAFLIPFALVYGGWIAAAGFMNALLEEYLPFVLLLVALYTVSGGIYIRGNLHGRPLVNTAFLLIGGLLASFMGTTGASMLLIRPLIRANDNRKSCAHVVIFFIFIVSNIGGSLTPLGDPPLFLGFLKGVTFFWTVDHVIRETAFLIVVLLVLFFLLDTWFYRKEGVTPRDPTPDTRTFGFEGSINFVLLAVVIALVLMSGVWKSDVSWVIGGTEVGLPSALRDIGMALVAIISVRITPKGVHAANEFTWRPMIEVAKLFAGIFLTMIPAIAMLQAGEDGAFSGIVRAVTNADGTPNAAAFFWATGALSSVLDNAPTYLVFFNTAGGDALHLMGPLAHVLAAVSSGAVFMGAITYIGNAPNLMVKAIADERGVRMPSFFGYMVWSVGILVPLFLIVTWFSF